MSEHQTDNAIPICCIIILIIWLT